MKKIKPYFVLIAVSILFITLCISSTMAPNAKATSDQGNDTTARQKEWFSMLYNCVNTNLSWRRIGLDLFPRSSSRVNISAESLNAGNWFNSPQAFLPGEGWPISTFYNPMIEKIVTGEYQDGQFVCGHNDNKLVKEGIPKLNISYKDVICDYNDYKNNGVLGPRNPNATCGGAYDSNGTSEDSYFGYFNDNAGAYFANLVMNKTFGGNVPAGALNKLTDLEHYYVLYDAFTTACVMGGPHYGDTAGYAYVISEKNGNDVVEAGYDGKSSPGKNYPLITYFYAKSRTCQDMANKLHEGPYVTALKESITNEDPSDDPSSDNPTESDPCYNAGVEGMSWILCPVVNNTTNTVDSFESTLKTLLSIDSNSLFSDGVAYNIWEIFRNIANAILVIVFLVIIFSQLTGYGIDNYGIKKMLPKLIVMGVLINLSYIICELAVDLSNILGVGLNNLFESVASAANIDTSNAGSVAAIVLVVLGAAATTAASGYLTGGGAGIIVALVLALISALVALLIFLAMIGIRMIIVVVFTVISPVAFALYILPNTQNLFKKWWKVFEAALVVYPICGVLYGAHFIVKAILSGSSNIFMNIAAIIAPFLPFFALPSLLKSAMAGLGSVAGAITAAGTAFRRGTQSVTNTAKSAVEGSERYKNYQADRGRSRKLNFARKTNEKLTRRQNNGQSLSDRQKRRLESARMIENAEYAEKLKRDAIVDGNRYETMRAGIKAKDEDQAINDRLALMRSSGEGGGIMVGGQRAAYTLDNLNARMQELERKSRSTALSSDEQSEMAALARGMVSQKGGAGMLNNIVRNAGNQDATGKHQLNANFMSSLGQIYNNDSTVAGKMTEKDGGMGGYMERFMPGGDGVNRNESFDDYFADRSSNGYAGNASRRIKSHEAGLNQSGEAFRYYLGTLTKDQAQSIMDNQPLLNSLDVDNRTEFISHARVLGVTGPSARDVNVINVPHTP